MSNLKEIIRTDQESGSIYLRSVITLAFFIDKPVHEHSTALIELLDRFVKSIPPETLKWGVTSATQEEWRETNEKTLSRLKVYLSPEGSRKRKLTAFRLNDSGASASSYSFRLVGKPMDGDRPDAVTLVQMTFPLEVIKKSNLENFILLVREFAELALPIYGYCSPGFNYSELYLEEAFSEIRRIVKRYPGYDVQMNDMTHVDIGKRVRGARWITFLGTELVNKLGGEELVKKKLPNPIVVENILSGVMIKAGEFPEIGDVNHRINTPLLKEIAKILEPVTLFQEVDLLSYFADFDEELLQSWEHRFLE